MVCSTDKLQRKKIQGAPFSAKSDCWFYRNITMPYSRNYFTLPHPLWMISILFGLYLLAASTIAPQRIPTYLGPFRTLGYYTGTNFPNFCVYTSMFAVVVHVLEAAYAGKLCHDADFATSATIKWVLSTLMFGFSSLIRLKPALKNIKSS